MKIHELKKMIEKRKKIKSFNRWADRPSLESSENKSYDTHALFIKNPIES